MKKKLGFPILSAIVIALLVWIASLIFSFPFNEWGFFIGLVLSIMIFFFNSSGGVLSKLATFEASEGMGKVQKEEDMNVNVGTVFYGSVIFTVINFVIMVIKYY